MKRAICLVLVLMVCLTPCAMAANGNTKYLYYSEGVADLRDLFLQFIDDIEAQYERDGDLSDVEVLLYFEYAETYMSLDMVLSLQRQAYRDVDNYLYAQSLLQCNNNFMDKLHEMYEGWQNGELSRVETIEAIKSKTEHWH